MFTMVVVIVVPSVDVLFTSRSFIQSDSMCLHESPENNIYREQRRHVYNVNVNARFYAP